MEGDGDSLHQARWLFRDMPPASDGMMANLDSLSLDIAAGYGLELCTGSIASISHVITVTQPRAQIAQETSL